MTGPEHYREAERLLAGAKTPDGEVVSDDPSMVNWIAAAQVHATLALAAATGLNDAEQGFMVEDLHNWRDVASVTPEVAS